ncbi:MAG: trypsin-like peptidase domain-containing protein [Polyangiales bacterium]
MDATALSDALATAVESAAASVVRVEGRCAGASGTVWAADGVVITANHAVGRAEELSVGLGDGRSLTATVAGRDPSSDVAVLRVSATDLTPAQWTDGEGLKVGHLALPLARPGKTVRATLGIVGALGDGFRTPTGATFDRYIEVDGSLPRGFSGGPLIDAKGRALGMNTGGVMRGGATVPTVTLRRIVAELLTRGRVGRGYLGVSVYPARLSDALATKLGRTHAVVVVGIEREGAAEAGGLKVGDVIASIDGVAIEGPGDLMSSLEGRAGAEVTLTLARADEVLELKLTAGTRP